MLTTRLIIRVIDADELLLAWTDIEAEARGDGRLWSTISPLLLVERAGTPHTLSVHWPDVHVEARTPLTLEAVTIGSTITLPWENTPVLIVGPVPGPLPPVTVRGSIQIGVPVGSLGARS